MSASNPADNGQWLLPKCRVLCVLTRGFLVETRDSRLLCHASHVSRHWSILLLQLLDPDSALQPSDHWRWSGRVADMSREAKPVRTCTVLCKVGTRFLRRDSLASNLQLVRATAVARGRQCCFANAARQKETKHQFGSWHFPRMMEMRCIGCRHHHELDDRAVRAGRLSKAHCVRNKSLVSPLAIEDPAQCQP